MKFRFLAKLRSNTRRFLRRSNIIRKVGPASAELAKKYGKNMENFPILESDALEGLVDYSFGDHSGVLGKIPQAYMKKATIENTEFLDKVKAHQGEVMTLFIDNIRLYKRPLEYSDWLHMKPIKPADREWLNTFADEDLLALCAQLPQKNFIIFTALEDTPLDAHIEGRIPPNVLRINAVNSVYFGGKIVPYPHALERKMYKGYNHHDILKEFLVDDTPAKKLLYVNHRADTGNRRSLYNMFIDKPWATVSPRTDYENYLTAIKKHKFVLCPSGNGIESARNWETLYLKRVPIFKRHKCLEFIFKDFPAIFVDDFSKVTEELLLKNEHLYERALKNDIEKLNLHTLFKERIKV